MVPSGLLGEDIGVGPLFGFQVEADRRVVSGFGVPSSVGVKFAVSTENGVSTTSEGKGLESDDGFQVLPGLGFDVEAVDVIEGNAGVAETTMSTVDVDLALVVAGRGVSTGRRSANGGGFVVAHGLVVLAAGPGVVLAVEDPRVVQTAGGGSMSSEDEHLIVLGANSQGDVLGTRRGLLSTLGILLFPDPVLAGHFEGVDVGDGSDFAALGSGGDSTVHEVLGRTYVYH